MRRFVPLALLLALLLPRPAPADRAGDPLLALLGRIPDTAFLVAGFDPALLADARVGAWLERAAPAAAAKWRSGLAAFRDAETLTLAVLDAARPEPVLFLTTRGAAESALPALAAIARQGQAASVAGERLLALGPAPAAASLLSGGSGAFRDARARMRAPRFWLSARPDKFARVGLLARLSAAEHAPLRALFERLERADLVVYESGGTLHLTVNATLDGPADPALAASVAKLESGFRAFAAARRPADPVAPFAPPKRLRLKAAVHGRGVIADLSPFPGALPELYLHLFHPGLDLDLRDLLSLAALAELTLDFDRAVELFDRALAEGRKVTGRRVGDANGRRARAESRGDALAADEAEAARKKAIATGVAFENLATDLKLQALLLGGRRAGAAAALAAPGAALRHPNAAALMKRMDARP